MIESIALLALLGPLSVAGAGSPGPAVRAQAPPADLALDGPVRLGGRRIDWGDLTTLPATRASRTPAGHCRFAIRFGVANLGPGPAPPSLTRLLLDNTTTLAELPTGALPAGDRHELSGELTLWSGEHVLYVQLDATDQVRDPDPGNNLRRIGLTVGDGCPDPRPRARPPGSGGPRTIPPPPGVHRPPPTGTRAPTQAPPAGTGSTGHRAAPPEGRPPQGSQSKPVPPGSGDCKATISVTRHLGATRTGARTTAIAAWEAVAFDRHGAGHRWDDAGDTRVDCERNVTWTCTVSGRPCAR